MPNPDPSLTPEAAANNYCAEFYNSRPVELFLAGHAHAEKQFLDVLIRDRDTWAAQLKKAETDFLRAVAERDALSAQRKEAESGWKCFHCGEVFINEACARAHFGRSEQNASACVIKAGAEGSMLIALRDAESHAADAWAKLHEDGCEARMALVTTHARHQQNLQAAECLGYERGLKDYSTVEKERDQLCTELNRAHSHVATMERDMVKLRAELERAHLANLKTLAVMEKMRTGLKKIIAGSPRGIDIASRKEGAMDWWARTAEDILPSAPSLALLEFAEKVWKEAMRPIWSQFPDCEDILQLHWLASDTCGSLTRATGDQK